MKIKQSAIALVGLFLVVSSGFSEDAVRAEIQLPHPIQQYYNDHNFISLYSNQSDREYVANHILLSLTGQQELPLPQHLLWIREAVSRLVSRVYEIDSGIKFSEFCPGKAKWRKFVRLSENVGLSTIECDPDAKFLIQHRAEIIETKKIRPFRKGIAIKVAVHGLNKGRQRKLLTLYRAVSVDKQKLKPTSDHLSLGRGEMIREEIHYWTIIDYEWRRQAVKVVFFGESAL